MPIPCTRTCQTRFEILKPIQKSSNTRLSEFVTQVQTAFAKNQMRLAYDTTKRDLYCIYTHRNPPKRKILPTRTDERHSTLTQLHKRANGVTGILIITQSHIKRLNSTSLVGWQNIHTTQCPPHPVPSPEGKHHNKSQKPLLRKIRKTVCTGHARVARRRRQRAMNPLRTWWKPQAHGRHIECRLSNTVRQRHKLHCFHRKRLPIKLHPHDLRGHPVEGGDELSKNLNIQ